MQLSGMRAGRALAQRDARAATARAAPLAHRHSKRAHVRAAAASSGGAAAGSAAAPDPSLAFLCGALSTVAAVKGAVGAVVPGRMAELALPPGAVTPEVAALMGVCASVCWLAAAWLSALRDAAVHDRLGSDTYKRLALGLGLSVILLAATNARYASLLGAPIIAASCVSAALLSYLSSRLYALGSKGASPLADLGAIAGGAAKDVASLFKLPTNFYSAFFTLQALSCLGLFAWLWPTSLTPLFPGGLTPAGSWLTRVSAATIGLVGVTAFTLKDAAERGRLGASTFKLLSLALAATSAQQVFYFYTLSGAGVALAEPLWRGILAQGAAAAVVCDVAYLTAKKK